MRSSKLRFASAALLGVLCAALVVWAEGVVSAQRKAAGIQPTVPAKDKDSDKDKDKDLRPADDDDIPFSFTYERDAKKQLDAVRQYVTHKEPPWNTICPLLQNILDSKTDSFFNVQYKTGARADINRISVKTEANRIIATFPKEGLEFYQQSYGQTATNLLAEAVKNNYDLAMLSDLSQRYFHTRAGAEGTILIGTLYLERGNYLEAAYAFERLMARPNTDELLTPRTLFKAALAFRRSGDPHHAPLTQTTLDRLQKATARNGLVIGRRTFTLDQLKAEIDRSVTAIRANVTLGEWAGRYGNAQRNGTVVGGPPFLVPAFDPSPMIVARRDEDKDANTWLTDELSRLFDRENKTNRSLPLPGFFPVTTPDMVIYRSYDGVWAVATRDHTVTVRGEGKLVRAGDTKWISKARFGAHQLVTPGDYHFDDTNIHDEVKRWWGAYKSPNANAASLLYENPLIGSLAHDGQNVYFVDDIAIPPPPALANPNNFNPGFGNPSRQSGQLNEAVQAGQLVAVNMSTGMQVWTLGRVETHRNVKIPTLPRLTEEQADKSADAFHLCLHAIFLGPPLPLNGRLYLLIELDGVVRLLCLDPANLVPVKDWTQKVPALLWTQKLGRPSSPENEAVKNSLRRHQGAFLAAGEGILLCPTNSGAVVGVDIMSRGLLWAHAYRRVTQTPPTRPQQFNPNPNGQITISQPLPVDRWRAAAPIVSGGRAIITAYDSDWLDCIDIYTGKLIWRVPRQADDLYVGGVTNDRVIVVGKTSVRAYHLTGENADDGKPKEAWKQALTGATPTGHGVPGKSVYYLPVRPENAGKENVPVAEIWAINIETGAVASKTGARIRKDGSGTELSRYGLGNLVFQDGLVIAQSAWEVAVYPQLELKKAEMDRKLKANPKDPEGLTDRGELLLDDGKLREAIADFKEARRNNPALALQRRLADKLYVAYTELLREDFPAAEPILQEYEGLCVVPVDDDLEPFEKKRREDDTLHRKRLYLTLLAKGREGQGRLGEAFDHYLALAQLGADQLQPDPEEPSVYRRADVTARGRIQAMIQRATPAARKTLEERVSKEWQEVEKGGDLKRLREFVDVFGPNFAVGSAAELKLAELLLRTNNDGDVRDAQVHLAHLRAAADDPVIRARATEALARLMVKNQLMEDAVGLYLQLGKEFPDVVIRDGKTGTDFLTDLLTDRRLLPYLEPARYPLPTKVEAKEIPGQSGNHVMSCEVEPEGELFPMYRRVRFAMDMVSSNGNQWTLRGYDRATGLERFTFQGLHPPLPQYNPWNAQAAKYVQASGHLLLVQIGQWVYCLDLSEKPGKKLWEKNLLGEGSAATANSITDTGADGEVVVNFTDNTRITIGKVSVIQPGYVGLLTRDGLEVVEPVTRRQLWNRRNIAERTYVYGDARYILLVETGVDRRPKSTRLLRAVDGMPADGAPDAGKILAAAKSYRVYGRNVLLSEGKGDQPHVLRMYDTLTGKDLWRKEYDEKAIPVRSMDPEWTGFVKPTGEVEILVARTGKPAGTFRLDEKYLAEHLKGCVVAQLFDDPERFFVTLDRGGAGGRNGRVFYGGNTVRTHQVNGPMYAFDRATGKRLWFKDGLLENQSLVMERFADIPVIAAAAQLPEKNGATLYRVVVIEKESGAVRFNKGLTTNYGFFNSLTVDAKNGEVSLNRGDTRISIKGAEPQANR